LGQLLKRLVSELEKKGELTGDLKSKFYRAYGERLSKALKAVEEKRVKKYVVIPGVIEEWIVVGKTRDYLVIGDFYCSCNDFYVDVAVRGLVDACYHLLAKEIARVLKRYEVIKVEENEYENLIREWASFE